MLERTKRLKVFLGTASAPGGIRFQADLPTVHYGFCPLVKFTYKDLAKLTALAAIFKTKSYFR